MGDPDVSGVDEGDEVRIVRTHGGVQTGPGGLGLHGGKRLIIIISDKCHILQAHLNLIREERPRVPRGGIRAEEQRAACFKFFIN